MMNPFSSKTTALKDSTLVELAGQIDEDADFSQIDIGISKKLTIDLGDVTRINSMGIRTWMIWMEKNVTDKDLTLRRCPKIIIDQFNVVAAFLPRRAKVESFYVPFLCEACNEEVLILLSSGIDFNQASATEPSTIRLPASVTCPRCKEPMEVEVNEKRFFKFLSFQP